MKRMCFIHTISLLFFFTMISGCQKEEENAANSIQGIWEVTDIKSIYGQFSENGFSPTETIEETGMLGRFEFLENMVEFEFTRNDTLFTGNDSWSIIAEKVNAGFTKETLYTLTIDNHFIFNVEFGDGTKNSERDAARANFIDSPEIGFGVLIELELEKI